MPVWELWLSPDWHAGYHAATKHAGVSYLSAICQSDDSVFRFPEPTDADFAAFLDFCTNDSVHVANTANLDAILHCYPYSA